MPEIFLQPDIVVGRTRDELVFSNRHTQREITISGWTEQTALSSPTAVLRLTLSALDEANARALLRELGSASFLLNQKPSMGTQTKAWAWAIPLAIAVASPSSLPRDSFSIVHTKTEALALPRGLTDSVWMESLRLFASGVRPIQLRKCYAFGATSRIISVIGDECDNEDLEAIWDRYNRHEGSAFVVALTGDATVSTFGTAPGRLHPAQFAIDQEIPLGAGVLLHRSGAAMACPDLRFCDIDPDPWAWGHSSDVALARRKAISEAIERYASGTVPYRELTLAPANELNEPYLDPCRYVSFTRDQIQRHLDLRAFNPDEPRYWVLGERADGVPTYVLADLVYNPFVPPNTKDQRVHCRANSSGVAFAKTREDAQRHAFLECFERDAFLRCWYGRVSPPKLSVNSSHLFADTCFRALEEKGFRVHLLVLAKTIPVIAAVGISDDAMLIGCAAGSPEEALEKALTELSMVLTGLPPHRQIQPQEIQRADDHTMLYRDPAIVQRASFLVDSKESFDISDLTWDGQCSIRGEVFFVRLPIVTNPEDHVWRCIAPEYIPMNFGYDTEPRGRMDVARLLRASTEIGWQLFNESDALLPHPFA